MAEEYLQYSHVEKQPFVSITLLQTIHSLISLNEKDIHVKIWQIHQSRSFSEAGNLCYYFVRQEQINHAKKLHIYDSLSSIEKQQPEKLWEFVIEEILHERLGIASRPFKTSYFIEGLRKINLSEDMHQVVESLVDYLNRKPSQNLRLWAETHELSLGLDVKTLFRWSTIVPKLAQDPLYIAHVDSFIEHMRSLMQAPASIASSVFYENLKMIDRLVSTSRLHPSTKHLK
jgi:hypothetical protein